MMLQLLVFLISVDIALSWPDWKDGSNGVKWAEHCDFSGNDLYNKPSTGEQCGGICEAEPRCTNFVWTDYNGGMCWLKSGSNLPAIGYSAGYSVCGYIQKTSTSGSANWQDTHIGYATYTGSGYHGGAMLLDPIDSNMEITALNPFDMNFNGIDAALGGAYLEVTGPKGTTTVFVTDLYPEGTKGALDLSPNAFGKIGNIVDGKIDISWKVVRGPVSGNIIYRIKEGSSQFWAAIQVRNHAIPIIKMAYNSHENWVDMKKMPYNHFLVTENLGGESMKLRMESIDGTVREDTIPGLPAQAASSAYLVNGNVKF